MHNCGTGSTHPKIWPAVDLRSHEAKLFDPRPFQQPSPS
jgi:hypothetical protein